MKLSKSQSKIYNNNNAIAELHKKNLALKNQAAQIPKEKGAKKVKKLAAEIAKNSLKASDITSANIDLKFELEQRRSVLQERIVSNPKKRSSAIAEIEAHSKLVSKHDQAIKESAQKQEAAVQKAAQKEKAAVQKAAQKQENTYQKEKTKLFKSASNFIRDPASLNKILAPLAQRKGVQKSVGAGEMARSGLSALGFAAKNMGSLANVVSSRAFYKEEAAKIAMGKTGKKEDSFFLKLLDDPDSVKFLEENGDNLGNLVETIAPTLISIGIRGLSKLPEFQKKIKAHEKKHGALAELEERLEGLEDVADQNELESKQIAELTEQIAERKQLEQSISTAKTLEALDQKGINAEYIQEKLLPIAINPLKKILEKPEDIIAVANAALEASSQKDPQKAAEARQVIIDKIDVGELIGSSGLRDFLINEGDNLAKVATAVMATNEGAKKGAEKLGVTPEMMEQVIPKVTQMAASVLSDTDKLTEVYHELMASNAKLSDIKSKEVEQEEIDRSELSEEQIQELDEHIEELKQQKNEVLFDMIGSASEVALEDGVLNSVRGNISGLLDENQEALASMVAHNFDRLAKANEPGQLLTGVDPSLAVNTVAAVTDLASVVLKETSNEQIRSLAASGRNLMVASEEESPAIVQGLINEGMAILGNPNVAASLQNVGSAIEGSNADISKVAVNAMANSELKGVFSEEQINGAVPIVTKVLGGALSSAQDIATIVTKAQELNASLDKQAEGLTPKQAGGFGAIIDSLSNIVEQPGISETLSRDLPGFLEANIESLAESAVKFVKKTPALAARTKEMGVSDELIQDAVKLGADMLSDAAPIVDKFARATLKEKGQLVTIISDIRDLENTPEENQKKAVMKVVSNVMALKESSPELSDVIDKELPALLEKNQEQLAKVIDEVIKTKAGPELKLKTEKIIKVVADNLPAVTELADLYSKGKYAAMFPKIVKLAFKKNVLSTAIGTLSRVRKHKKRQKKAALEDVIGETIEKDIDKEAPASPSPDKGVVANLEQGDRVGLEDIRKKMGKHIGSSKPKAPVISPAKQEMMQSSDKGK